MAGKELNFVLRHVRRLVRTSGAGDHPDANLLERFSARHDEAAFAEVLERHGPLVLGVCRRVLGDAHDAEDAFQATFLVFARRAASIRCGASLSSWLYGVAYRVALEARTRLARRRRHERQAATMPRGDSPADDSWVELRPLLDEELNRLPEKYRAPLVLHYLEGMTKPEAARELGCSEGTISGRLDRARKLLRQRLLRRGVAPDAALGAILTGPAVPAALQEAARQAALGGAVAPQAAGLAAGVLRSLTLARLRMGADLALLAVALAAGTGWAARSFWATSPGDPAPENVAAPARPDDSPPNDPDGAEEVTPRDRAADRLEAVSPQDWEASWKEDLDAAGQPAGEVVRRLVRSWGLTVETEPAQERALAKPVQLKLRGRPRLELIENVCRQVGVYPVYPDGTTRSDGFYRTLRLKDGSRPYPVAFAGPFLVEVQEVKEFAPSATGEMKVRFLAVGLPPAVALPLRHGEPIKFQRIVDPHGDDLIDATHLPSWTGNVTFEGFDTTPSVYLKGLVRGVTALSQVEGTVRVPIATRVATLSFTELKAGEARQAGDVQVTLQKIVPERHRINDEPVKWQGFDFGYRGIESFRIVFAAHDRRGRLLHCQRDNGGSMGQGEGYRIVAFAEKPAAITAKVMTEVKHIDYPFRLENVPLPSPEQMPDR